MSLSRETHIVLLLSAPAYATRAVFQPGTDTSRPAALKEASLDSPTFRSIVIHYAEQVELVEKWLDAFIKASVKLVNEVVGTRDYVTRGRKWKMLMGWPVDSVGGPDP